MRSIALSLDEARCNRMLALTLPIAAVTNTMLPRSISPARDLNPCDADTLVQTGFFRALLSNDEVGLALLDKAIQLNPMHLTEYYYDWGEALLFLGSRR